MNRPYILISTAVILFVAINPLQWLTILLLCSGLLLWLYRTYGHTAILTIIAIRPTLDILRSTGIAIQDTFISGTLLLGGITILWSFIILYVHWRAVWNNAILRNITAVFLVFLLYSGLTSTWSIEPLTSLQELFHVVSIILLFIVGAILIETKQIRLKALLRIILIGSLIPMCIGIWQLIQGAGIRTFTVQDRIYSTFAHPNVFALYILIIGSLGWLLYQLRPIVQSYVATVILPILGILLLSTYTRAAWVGAILFSTIYGLLQYRKKTLIGIAIIITTYISFYPVNQFFINTFDTSLTEYQLISRIFERNEEADSIAWRISVVTESTNIIREKPLLGFGYGTFPTVWEIRRDPSFRYDDSNEAHNDYLRLTVESGLIGLSLYLVVLAMLLLHSIKTVYNTPTKKETIIHTFLLSWVITYAALSVSDNMLNHTAVAWIIWLVWGALLATKYEKDHFLA